MTDRPQSPPTKTVSFASSPLGTTFSSSSAPIVTSSVASTSSISLPSDEASTSSLSSSSTAAALDSTVRPLGPKRRRSSIKQGLQMPYKPPAEDYTHRDPLIRRLRLNNGYGKRVSLEREFGRDVKLVVFFFAASWRGASKEPWELVTNFQRRFPHQLKVVFVSIDETKSSYLLNSKDKNYLSMEWNDGSNSGSPSSTTSPSSTSEEEEVEEIDEPPVEPFLLAGDTDLEEETSLDPATPPSLYLRPYSRVYLTEKWQVLGMPNLVVYHPETREVLSYHARFELLREGKLESTWEKWSKGERITFGVTDFVYALRWTITFLIISSVYLLAVNQGVVPNYIATWSSGLSQAFGAPGAGGAVGGKIEL
ncbi:uncharacterized protein JCM6883_001619 [Sporobolomyces salmoneus]|uniref:uncharacterized protein n=1 Tax=Sporobolomyces salmoneus TaxID=183962 RepID=UPI00317226F9